MKRYWSRYRYTTMALIVLLIFAIFLIRGVTHYRACEDRGGHYVMGIFGYVCVQGR